MGNLVVILNEEELLELQAVLMDRDEAGALEFLQARIAPKIPRKGNAPCDSTRLNPFLLKSRPEG